MSDPEFRLGAWLVVPARGQLRRAGENAHLEPKSMEVLLHLCQRRGEVVSKSALIEAVWGGAFVTDEVLTHAIWDLRRTLGDDARNPSYIQTLHKRGYRLVAEVSPIDPTAQTSPADSGERRLSLGRRDVDRRWSVGRTALLLLGALIIAVLFMAKRFGEKPPLAATPASHRVALLEVTALESRLPSPPSGASAEVLYERILSELTALPEVDVVAADSRPRGARSATHRLDASIVLSDGLQALTYVIRRTGTAEVVQAAILPLATPADTVRLPAHLARQVRALDQVAALGLFDDPDLRHWVSLERHDPEAVLDFVKAVPYVYRHEVGARPYLEKAIEGDPGFVAPRLWLLAARSGGAEPAALAADRAALIDLRDEATPFEQTMIDWVEAQVDGDLANQKRHLEVALGVAPNNNILLVNLGMTLYSMGNYGEALEALAGPLEEWSYPGTFPIAARCAILVSDLERARDVLRGGLASPPVDPQIWAMLEAIALYTPDPGAARKYRQRLDLRLREMAPEVVDLDLAGVYSHLADLADSEGRAGVAQKLREKSGGVGLPS